MPLEVDDAGNLQIRVYPIDADGLSWNYPIDTFDVAKATVAALTAGPRYGVETRMLDRWGNC